MKISYQPTDPTIEVTEAIVLNGREIGEMICRPNSVAGRYHAVIKVQHGPRNIRSGLAQGHGATKDEAITNAFSDSRRDAEGYLINLAHLAKEMEVDIGGAQ